MLIRDMALKSVRLAVALAALQASDAFAAEDSSWILAGGYSRTLSSDDAASDVDAASLSLERSFGTTGVGLGGGLSWRSFAFPEAAEPIDVSGYSLGGWVSHEFSAVSASLSADYAEEKGDFVLASPFSQQSFPASGKSTFLTVGASLSRAFGGETRIAPAASIAWSRVETTATIDLAAPQLSDLEGSFINEGVSGSLGASFAHDLNDRLTLYAGAAAAASDNAAAVYQMPGGGYRYGGPRTLGDQGSDVWGEFSGGVVVRLRRASLAFDATGTSGLQSDYLAISVSTSFSF